ncbi:MAG: Flp pilus assembly protein CpaB [Alphaproteobacteria bacterium]|nr:Flp pilus assembly protein CpaB [Alphaproteobacteria bacterium]
MRLRDIIGLAIALVLAVGVALLTRLFLTKVEQPKPVAVSQPISLTKILVAGKNLLVGDKVRQGDLVWQEWPQQSLNPVYIMEGTVKSESLVGGVVRFNVLRGEPVLLMDIIRQGEHGVLAAVLDPGKRAISIDVTPATANSGLILPGDYVDVILSSVMGGEGTATKGKSETVLKNVKVVAMDTEIATLDDKTKTPPHVATLEVNPEQAEILLAASKDGTLNLSLHSFHKNVIAQEIKAALKKKIDKVLLIRGKEKAVLEFQEK